MKITTSLLGILIGVILSVIMVGCSQHESKRTIGDIPALNQSKVRHRRVARR